MTDIDPEMQIVRPVAIQRTGFGSTEIENRRETSSTALAERAKAEVQARFILAVQRPRDVAEARVRILAHCKRRGFAERAEYAKPVGGQSITGPSIRFVETALQEFGNVLPESTVVYDDEDKRIVRVSVTDLERNITNSGEILVEKFVERRKTKTGDEVIGQRLNKQGEAVYRIRATEDDFANKQASAESKMRRNLGLRILPADVVDESMDACRATRKAATVSDPAAAQKQVADVFFSIGVPPTALADYLGHALEGCSPAELDELRAVFTAIREGEAAWPDAVAVKKQERGETEAPKKPQAAQQRVRARLEQRRAKAAAPTPAPTAPAGEVIDADSVDHLRADPETP